MLLASIIGGACALASCGNSTSGVGPTPSRAATGTSPSITTTTLRSTPSPTGAPTSTATLPPTSTTAAGGSAADLVPVLQAFFAGGCNGTCTRLNEPTSAFTITLDQHDPTWARWSVVDPSIGSGYGYAHVNGGTWAVVAGPGSAAVGCPPSASAVPARVLADFGATCP